MTYDPDSAAPDWPPILAFAYWSAVGVVIEFVVYYGFALLASLSR
jgi:uncharacterized membrane protein YjfL (UPF0719 family)